MSLEEDALPAPKKEYKLSKHDLATLDALEFPLSRLFAKDLTKKEKRIAAGLLSDMDERRKRNEPK